MDLTRFRAPVFMALVIVALIVAPIGVAGAGPNPVPKVTGGFSSGMYYASFNAFDFVGTTSPDRGSITWTDYSFSSSGTAGSGVWKLAGTANLPLTFASDYTHRITVSTTPLSNTSSAFTGTGYYEPPPPGSQASTISGEVSGTNVSFHLAYHSTIGTWAGYSYHSSDGVIAPDGSVSGTAVEYLNGTATGNVYPWTMPVGSAVEVYTYTAAITCVDVEATSATFGYTIPHPIVNTGLGIVMKVSDGGVPGSTFDRYGYITGTTACDDATVPSMGTISSGNIVRH